METLAGSKASHLQYCIWCVVICCNYTNWSVLVVFSSLQWFRLHEQIECISFPSIWFSFRSFLCKNFRSTPTLLLSSVLPYVLFQNHHIVMQAKLIIDYCHQFLSVLSDTPSSTGLPATQTKLMQYLLPFRSGRLCPRWVPSTLTVSPFIRTLTYSQFTSSFQMDIKE